VRDAPEKSAGRGLFLSARGVRSGAFLCRYSGAVRDVASLPAAETAPRTHMLRLRGSSRIVDGLPLASRLVRRSGGEWAPASAESDDWCCGYAALANAARSEAGANARMIFLPDDTAWRAALPEGERGRSLPRALAQLLPTAAFLVAKRDLQPLEEIKARQQTWSQEQLLAAWLTRASRSGTTSTPSTPHDAP